MLIYVAHCYNGNEEDISRAASIVHDLQVNDLENCYICPILAFAHIKCGEIKPQEMIDLRLDVLTVCDCLLIASPISSDMQAEIDFALLIGTEVTYLNENERNPYI